jgi:hypothetical protein
MSPSRLELADGVPFVTALGRTFDVTASDNGRAYRIFVDIPETPPPSEGFPVMVILDGNLHFALAAGLQRSLAMAGEVRPAVIVGIGYPTDNLLAALTLRFQDLSLPARADWLAELGWSAPGMTTETTGGLEAFLEMLDCEMRPALARLVPTNPADYALFGHSLAGHAVLHALFRRPSAWRSVMASSPSIWWADDAVLAGERALNDSDLAGRRILLAVGALEAHPDRAALAHFGSRVAAEAALSRSRMVENVQSLGARLARRPGAEVTTTVFEGEGHVSVIPAALCRALQFAFGLDTPAAP